MFLVLFCGLGAARRGFVRLSALCFWLAAWVSELWSRGLGLWASGSAFGDFWLIEFPPIRRALGSGLWASGSTFGDFWLIEFPPIRRSADRPIHRSAD